MPFNIYMTFVETPADAILSNFPVSTTVPSSTFSTTGASRLGSGDDTKLDKDDVKPVIDTYATTDKRMKYFTPNSLGSSITTLSSVSTSNSSSNSSGGSSEYTTTDSGNDHKTDSSFSTDSELNYSTSSANSRQRKRCNKNRKYAK